MIVLEVESVVQD